MTIETFGDAYYGAERPAHRSPESKQERMIRELLGKDVKQRCEKAVRQWNQSVRDQLRTECGLRLASGDERKSIPVRVTDGLPLPFHSVVREFEDWRLWWLAMRRPLLLQAGKSLEELQENFDQMYSLATSAHRLAYDERMTRDSLRSAETFIDRLLKLEESRQLLARIKGIKTDVLGAYFFNRPGIELYWIVIGICAPILGVAIEDLLVVVLAHELAHGYSHIGRDIDGRNWRTADFSHTDRRVVEGIAQFYTQAVCRRMHDRMPSLEEAFRRLLGMQSAAYTDFEAWLKDEELPGEIMRAGMLECRVHSIRDYEKFRGALKKVADGFRTKDRQRQLELSPVQD